MELKNEALQKLYDKLTSDMFGDPLIDEIFKKCDEELSDSITFAQIKDLRDRCDILERTNESLLGANLDLATKKRQLEKQVMQTTETLEKVNADHNELQRNIDILSASEWEAISSNKKLEKDLDDAKKNVEYFRHSRDDWKSSAKHAEEEVKDLKKKLVELQQDYHELYEKNGESNARADCLHKEVLWYRKHCKEQSDKIQELRSRLNSMCNVKYGEYVRSRDTGYKNGQTDLWDKLQNVNDVKPWNIASFYPDVTCMDDILNWDLEDFLDAYKSWQEKKEQERIKHMRDHLVRFCMWRRCDGCPLHTDGFICGRGKGFCDMTYEELKKHYEKVGDCGRCPFKRKDD